MFKNRDKMNLQELHAKCLENPRNKELWSLYADMLIENGFDEIGEFVHINLNYDYKKHIKRVIYLYYNKLYKIFFQLGGVSDVTRDFQLFPESFFNLNMCYDFCSLNTDEPRYTYFERVLRTRYDEYDDDIFHDRKRYVFIDKTKDNNMTFNDNYFVIYDETHAFLAESVTANNKTLGLLKDE